MDCKNPIRGKGFFPLFVILLFTSIYAFGQSSEQKVKITGQNRIAKLQALIEDFKREAQEQEKKIQTVKKHLQFKSIEKKLDGTVVTINSIGSDGTPLFYTTYMDPTSKVSRADALYKDGVLDTEITGKGMQIGVWDAGAALVSHQEFENRVFNDDGSTEVDTHSTMVTGAMVSTGIKKKAKGVAFEAEALTHDWSRDKIEVAEAAANGLLVSNHSYGIKTDRVPDWYFGSYIKVSQDWDKIMYNAPYYLMVSAAGNSQRSSDNQLPNYGKSSDGFDLLLGFTTAKNGLVIAGADAKLNGKGELKSASVSGYSSFGPIDDGRIKPDIAGDGTLIYSTSSASNSSYNSSMGTSMAAPGVSAALVLLQQYNEVLYESHMKAATLKGLVLHSADDVQAKGPDYKMGWGVLNTKKAGEIIKNKDYSTLIEEHNLTNGDSYSITVNANGKDPLSASISWTDVAGSYVNRGDLNESTPALVNDLDIRITHENKTYFPWKLSAENAAGAAIKGDNLVDPFERIDLENASGEYTITISHKGNFQNGNQDFSLIVTGVSLNNCQLNQDPDTPHIEQADENTCAIAWEVNPDALYEVQFKELQSEDWQTQTTWENQLTLENLEYGKQYQVRLRTFCSQNLASSFSDELQFIFDGAETEPIAYDSLSQDNALSLRVYPNPAVSELQIDTEFSKDAYYSVTGTNGMVVKSGRANEKIDVAELATGLYILAVQDYSGIKSTKFFKD